MALSTTEQNLQFAELAVRIMENGLKEYLPSKTHAQELADTFSTLFKRIKSDIEKSGLPK